MSNDLQFFVYDHLRYDLKPMVMLFANTAASLVALAPDNPQRELAMTLLIQAKDAAVRALIYVEPKEPIHHG